MSDPQKPPTITSQALPPSQRPSAQTSSPAVPVETVPYDQIVAKPLRSPNFINLKPKNGNMSLYWGNRSVGEKESGMRFDQLIAMGFRCAKPDEVLFISPTGSTNPCPPSLQRDGRIMYGDLILLVIAREDYVGALKWNAENAERRVRRFGSTQDTSGDSGAATASAGSAIGGIVRGKAAAAGKISAYIPPLAEVDAATADNSGIPANLAEAK